MKTAMTKSVAEKLVAKFDGNVAKAAREAGVARSTMRGLIGAMPRKNSGHRVPAEPAPDSQAPEKTKVKGFALTTATRVREKKPTATLRSRFYELKRGTAYRESDLAKEWGVSPETVRKYAKDAECFAYVETRSEFWEACIMHPDTAAQQLRNS